MTQTTYIYHGHPCHKVAGYSAHSKHVLIDGPFYGCILVTEKNLKKAYN